MTIQRQYSLPNCKLVLQGLSNDASDLSGRPLLSMVTNVECYLAGQKEPFTGGRAFLDSLVTTVSEYAQGYLSGIQHLIRRDRRQQAGLVQIEQVEHNLHRLTIRPEAEGAASQVDLTTVQLFDLVEAVDQLFADAQTLPDLSLKLNSLSKRHVIAAEPVAKRVVPAAIGLSGLAAAAAIFFVLPAPQVRRTETASTTSQTAASPAASPTSPAAGSSPTPTGTSTASPTAASTAIPTTSPTASPTTGPIASSAASTPAPSGSASAQGAGLNLADTPEITDPTELDRLTVQLYDKLDLSWKKKPTFDGELVYRVGVNRAGDIVGYKYTNDAALTYLSDTPLGDVQFRSPEVSSSPTLSSAESPSTTSSTTSSASKEPLAQFRVVFKSNGVLEVSPWDGQPPKSNASTGTSTGGSTSATEATPSASP
jgi:hypothetical protein